MVSSWKLMALLACFLLSGGASAHLDQDGKPHSVRERTPIQTILVGNRIVGGTTVPAGAFPYFVHVADIFVCGGTLIHEDIVLASAQCFDIWTTDAIIGAIELFGTASDEIIPLDTSTAGLDAGRFVHPDFNATGNLENDIMIVKLDFPSMAPPITLNNIPSPPFLIGSSLTVTGFGNDAEDGAVTFDLREVDVPVQEDMVCIDVFEPEGTTVFPLRQICAGGVLNEDACRGDTGGPLFDKVTNTQFGIISNGLGCGREGIPAIYTDVAFYYDWIQEQICAFSANPPISCESASPSSMPSSAIPSAAPSASEMPSGGTSPAPSNPPTPIASAAPSLSPTATPRPTVTVTDKTDGCPAEVDPPRPNLCGGGTDAMNHNFFLICVSTCVDPAQTGFKHLAGWQCGDCPENAVTFHVGGFGK